MQDSKKVAVNTLAQYVRTVINAVLSLITVRWILVILGEEDYGIYMVIAGVTSMLSFITNTLISTTQRYLSFYQGKNDLKSLKQIFATSTILHLALGILIVLILVIIEKWVFNSLIIIPEERLEVAYRVYIVIALIIFMTLCAAPFRALLVAHENIVYVSIIDILDGVLKMVLVLVLQFISIDKLFVYSIIMLLMQVVNFLAFSLFSFKKYEECVMPRLSYYNKSFLKNMFQYSGWVLYGTACVVGRSQGVTILINRFLSTVANAAYGLGSQISGVINSVSSSVLNAMRPQIVKSEGSKNRDKALNLTTVLCKISYSLMLIVCIPCVFEMEGLLVLWLKDVPQYTVLFSQMAVLCCLVDSMTIALTAMSEAVGNVKGYNLVVSTLKLAAIPFMWFFLKNGQGAVSICVIYIISEIVSGFSRVFFVGKTAGLNVAGFFKNVLFCEIAPTIITIAVCYIITHYMEFNLRFLITFSASFIVSVVSIYYLALNKSEKKMVINLVKEWRK